MGQQGQGLPMRSAGQSGTRLRSTPGSAWWAPPPGSVVINGGVANPKAVSYRLQALPQIMQTVSFLEGSTQQSTPRPGRRSTR